MSCDDWIAVVRPHLAATLVDPPALERIRDLARRLPGDALAALEVRLAPDRAVVDLSLRLTRSDQALRLAADIPCEHLQSFLRGWAKEGKASPISSVWLEFDLEGEAPPWRRPVACAGLRHPVEPGWVSGSLLPSLHGGPLTRYQRELVETCCAAIPPEARLLYAFSLQSRGAGEVRLEVLGFDPPGALRYLRRTAPETVEPVAEGLALLATERLHVSLDIGERVSPRVGVEGSFRGLPSRQSGWRELFDRLVARGLCTPAKRDAVFVWPGHDSFWTAPEAWPRGSARLGWVCIRSLSHVKLVVAAEREPEAKVYLLFTPLRKPPARYGSPAAR